MMHRFCCVCIPSVVFAALLDGVEQSVQGVLAHSDRKLKGKASGHHVLRNCRAPSSNDEGPKGLKNHRSGHVVYAGTDSVTMIICYRSHHG